MTFKLILSAKRKWRRLDGSNQLAELIEGVPFKDGIKITKHAAWALAYRRYSTDYVDEEAVAQDDQAGVWSGEFVPPWELEEGRAFTVCIDA